MSGLLVQTVGMMRRRKGPTTMGELYQGGYYAGVINDGGIKYMLLVGPAASCQYKNSLGSGTLPTATLTLTNGLAATNSFNGYSGYSSVYTNIQNIRNTAPNGKNDWYLPARDELELCYRNLKPTSDSNIGDARISSTSYFMEGGIMGENTSSDPVGSKYIASVPAVTSATIFRSGGAQAFNCTSLDKHWSCTAAFDTRANNQVWGQRFQDGLQNNLTTTEQYSFRLIRREAA